jgi:hypothetical protein
LKIFMARFARAGQSVPAQRAHLHRILVGALERMSHHSRMVTIDDVRALASTLPRSYEALVRGRVKFRVGQIVYLALSSDGRELGFAFPKEWRQALVESEPEKFSLPDASNMRYHWAVVRLDAVDEDEMRALVLDAWAMVVPNKVVAAYLEESGRSA